MKKVYIVDDDRDIVDAVTMILQKEGFEVKSQFDSRNLSENLCTSMPDLLLLDVLFPENDGEGFDIARDIRHDAKLKNIPILMLSAVNEKGIYAGTFSNNDIDDTYLPVDAFIEKPVDSKTPINKINEILS